MTKEVLNRVEKSGIVTIDFDEFQTPKILVIDIKDWLNDGLYLIEKDFRKRIEKHNWINYKNCYVSIFCSSDAIIPQWAYMLISSKISEVTSKSYIGNFEKLQEKIFEDYINSIDCKKYLNKSVIIKGCAEKKIPLSAYHLITSKLKGCAKSIMYGEACSSVPIFKRAK